MKAKYTPVLIRLTKKQAEQLRKMAYITRDSQSKIIRDLFDNFISNPPIDKTNERLVQEIDPRNTPDQW